MRDEKLLKMLKSDFWRIRAQAPTMGTETTSFELCKLIFTVSTGLVSIITMENEKLITLSVFIFKIFSKLRMRDDQQFPTYSEPYFSQPNELLEGLALCALMFVNPGFFVGRH